MNGRPKDYKHDYVGSFLRPKELIDARLRFERNEISVDELRETEGPCN